nr:hypothetical protein [Tanacetum cinerariifolium]
DFILVQVYMDDIIFGSSNPQLCREFEALMYEKIQMSAMGELNFFLGLQVLQREDGIFLSHDKCIRDILKKFGFLDVRSSNTPMDKENPWGKDGPGKDGHPKLGLWYPKASPFDLVAYSDSASQDRKSTTGGSQFLGRRLISWQCKKQTIVATSTTEVEYVAAASCCGQVLRLISWQCKKQTIVATSSTEAEYVAAASYCRQVLWIQNQMMDYGFNFMNTTIFIDNQSTICIVKNPVFHQRTKHIEIRHHFIRDANEKNLIQVLKIHTDDNVADLLTKAFDGPRFEFLVVHIGMVVSTAASCTFFLLTGWFLLVVLIPAGSFVPAGSYGLSWWLRVPAGRHTSAGGFIFIDGCVFLLLSRFLLIVDSFCWLDTFILLALFMLSKHLFKLLT